MEAVPARRYQRRERARSRSFRGNFFFFSGSSSKGSMKKPLAAAMALASPPAPEAKKLGVEADDDAYGLTRASSVPLCSPASLDSDSPSASSSRSSATSSVSSSPSASGVLFSPPAAARRKGSSTTSSSPAAGAAGVVLCLLMMVFCGRVGATVLTSAALYLFPLRWHARPTGKEDGVGSLECDADEEETAKN